MYYASKWELLWEDTFIFLNSIAEIEAKHNKIMDQMPKAGAI